MACLVQKFGKSMDFDNISDSYNDRRFFFLCIIVGILGILLLRNYSESSVAFSYFDWSAVALSVSIIIIYSIYVYNPKFRVSVSLDRAGDNAYYLGLLFTLSSLAFSLYQLSDVSDAGSKEIVSLLPDFGVALFSTIVGIAARIVLQQFGDDNYTESIARDELSVAVGKFRQNLIYSNDSMRKINTAIQRSAHNMAQNMQEMVADQKEMTKSMHDNVVTLSSEMKQQVQGVVKLSKSVVSEVNQYNRNISVQIKQLEIDPKFEKSVVRFSESLDKLNGKYHDIYGTHAKSIAVAVETTKQLKTLGVFSEAVLKKIDRSVKRSIKSSDNYATLTETASRKLKSNNKSKA